jgi:hypothetical protein
MKEEKEPINDEAVNGTEVIKFLLGIAGVGYCLYVLFS